MTSAVTAGHTAKAHRSLLLQAGLRSDPGKKAPGRQHCGTEESLQHQSRVKLHRYTQQFRAKYACKEKDEKSLHKKRVRKDTA